MFHVEDLGTLILIRPLTDRVEEWLREHVSEDAQYFGNALVVSPATWHRSSKACSRRALPSRRTAIGPPRDLPRGGTTVPHPHHEQDRVLRASSGEGMVAGGRSGCRGEAVATHYCCDRRKVGGPAHGSVEDGRNLAEEVRAENAGGNDR